ncbi:MAG: hypothetical protein WA869_23750 [Alloacidobacterium sp.]|jgi:hypothetical protein
MKASLQLLGKPLPIIPVQSSRDSKQKPTIALTKFPSLLSATRITTEIPIRLKEPRQYRKTISWSALASKNVEQNDPIMPSLALIGQPYFSLEVGGPFKHSLA